MTEMADVIPSLKIGTVGFPGGSNYKNLPAGAET